MTYEELLAQFQEYADHQEWRCQYRKRYRECVCGLDALCDKLSIPRVPVNDPEAK